MESKTPSKLINNSAKITHNVLSLTIGQGLTFLLNFFSIVLAARHLGVENFGLFTSLLAVITIFSKIIDFGLSPIAFREHSKKYENFTFINTSLSIRLVLAIILVAFANILFAILNYTETEFILSNLLFLNIFFSFRMANFTDLLNIPFKVRFKMFIPMTLSVIESGLVLVSVILMLIFGGSLLFFVIGYTVANLPGFVVLVVIANKRFNYKIKINFDRYSWYIKEALPLTGFVVLTVVFQQLDVILLKYLQTNSDAGIFSAALRITLPMNIIPTSIVMTIFPLIVKNIEKKNFQQNDELISFAFKILFLIALITFLVFGFKPVEIINLIFGLEYVEASVPTVLLLFSQLFLFYNFLGIDLLTAHGQQKNNFYYAVVLVVMNVTLSLLLIPSYSYNGAAFSKALSSIISFLILFFLLKRYNIPRLFGDKRFLIWISLLGLIIFLLSLLSLYIYLIGVIGVLIVLFIWLPVFNVRERKFILDHLIIKK